MVLLSSFHIHYSVIRSMGNQNVRDELHIVGSFNYCIISEIHSKIHCLGYVPMVPHISNGCLFRFINTKKLWLRGELHLSIGQTKKPQMCHSRYSTEHWCKRGPVLKWDPHYNFSFKYQSGELWSSHGEGWSLGLKVNTMVADSREKDGCGGWEGRREGKEKTWPP